MNLTRTMNELGDLYLEKMTIPDDTFEVQTEKKVKLAKGDKKAFVGKKSGPEDADGFKKDIIDPKTAKADNYYEPKKFSQNNEKTETQKINTFMNKSIFDRLYEEVMLENDMHLPNQDDSTDAEALGLPGEHEGAGVDGEEVTITLSRDLAEKLHDVLMGVLGSHEGEPTDELEDEGASDEGTEDEQTLGEATDIEPLSDEHGKKLMAKGSQKVPGTATSEVDGKEGNGDVQGIVNDGKPQPLKKNVGGGVPSNKVAGNASKVGKTLFGAAK